MEPLDSVIQREHYLVGLINGRPARFAEISTAIERTGYPTRILPQPPFTALPSVETVRKMGRQRTKEISSREREVYRCAIREASPFLRFITETGTSCVVFNYTVEGREQPFLKHAIASSPALSSVATVMPQKESALEDVVALVRIHHAKKIFYHGTDDVHSYYSARCENPDPLLIDGLAGVYSLFDILLTQPTDDFLNQFYTALHFFGETIDRHLVLSQSSQETREKNALRELRKRVDGVSFVLYGIDRKEELAFREQRINELGR